MVASVDSSSRLVSAASAAEAGVFSPVHRPRTSLAIRLSLPTNLAVVGTMAVFTGVQLAADLGVEGAARRASLAQSLAPLIADLERGQSRAEAGEAVARFHQAFLRQGRPRHVIDVVTADGRSLAAAGDPTVFDERDVLSVRLPLSAPALAPEPVVLVAADVDVALRPERSHRWRAWAAHLAITAAMLQVLLYVVVRSQIAAPIERLIEGVRKMQRGYWRDLADPGGAWELRWLGSRFRAFGEDLDSNVNHLVAAQWKAFARASDTQRGAFAFPDTSSASDLPKDGTPAAAPARLEQAADRLRRGGAADPTIRALAQLAWDRLAKQAEELGIPALRCELEDAALRILDPAGWRDVASRVEAERPRLEALALARARRLHDVVSSHGITCVAVEQRVKHSAGVWRKMQHKGLQLREVHDLVAVRIIVATESDCYFALRAVQGVYMPIVGRFKDYIAAPKPNGYRGLHLSVCDADDEVFEVQIRSVAMHRHAEHGTAAHARYKEQSVVQPRRTLDDLVRATVRRWRPVR